MCVFNLPETGVSRWPFQLMLLSEMECKRVTPRERLVAKVTLVAWNHVILMQKVNEYISGMS